MEWIEQVPGGIATLGGLGVILALVVAGVIKKTIQGAVLAIVVIVALGGWAYFDSMTEGADAVLERAKEAAVEQVEKLR